MRETRAADARAVTIGGRSRVEGLVIFASSPCTNGCPMRPALLALLLPFALAPSVNAQTSAPFTLEQAMAEARAAGAHYLLYCRFAKADDRIGNADEWADQEALDRVGLDSGVIQIMLIETSTQYLIDTARIRSRGGLLTFHDNKPEDLIARPLAQYARGLLGMSDQ